jgi:hypothetical protein
MLLIRLESIRKQMASHTNGLPLSPDVAAESKEKIKYHCSSVTIVPDEPL